MQYTNPVIKGFYPDPSVCYANGKYYLVCSSFQYFPGVPLFESENLVNWKQIGHVLTKKSQIMLEKVNSSGGVFAPTIRYHDGRFYMVTTNNTTQQNFYVYTDDIYGEWSKPLVVEQDGIDPSLLFDDGHVYFISAGRDEYGDRGVVQSEIDIATGKKLSHSKCIWHGSGGRFLESPHMYKIGDTYYLMAAEGGTEYGHMITYARADDVWGEFEDYPDNPVLTNRNKAPEIIQGIGHGDLIQDKNGSWHILCLGFRQIDMWLQHHTLGRETFLIPAAFHADGWFSAGNGGTAECRYEIEGDFIQEEKRTYTFENTRPDIEWCYLRHPAKENYAFIRTEKVSGADIPVPDKWILHGSGVTLEEIGSPTFIGIRQRDFSFTLKVKVSLDGGEAGVSVYSCENEHYDIALRKEEENVSAILKLNIGSVKHLQTAAELHSFSGELIIRADNLEYRFFASDGDKEVYLGKGLAKYLSSEVSNSFTGVVLGLYAIGENTAEFTDFSLIYE